MKGTTRTVTRTVALTLALLAAPATFANDSTSDASPSRDARCACMADHSRCAQSKEMRRDESQPAAAREQEPSNAAEGPIFTDQG